MLPSTRADGECRRRPRRPTAIPSTSRKYSAEKLQSAKIAPTERSMPPVIRQNPIAERDEAEFGEQPQQRQRVLHRGIVGNRQREIEPEPDHHRERDDRLEPLLQQQFRQQQPRREPPHRRPQTHPSSTLSKSALGLNAESGAAFYRGAGRCAAGCTQLLLRQREAVGAVGVALIEPDRPRVIFEVPGAGLVAGFQQRLAPRSSGRGPVRSPCSSGICRNCPELTWSQSSCEPSPEA